MLSSDKFNLIHEIQLLDNSEVTALLKIVKGLTKNKQIAEELTPKELKKSMKNLKEMNSGNYMTFDNYLLERADKPEVNK